MPYTKFHAAWEDSPDGVTPSATPITAEALDHIEQGITDLSSGAAGGVLAGTYPDPSFAVDMATQAELDAHVNDTSAAHAASAISIVDAGSFFSSATTEGALQELAAVSAPAGFTNIKALGAVGDGVADDTDAILDALAIGGLIFIPAGVYLTDPIIVPKGAMLQGVSGNARDATSAISCLKLKSGSSGPLLSPEDDDAIGVRILDLLLDLNSNAQSAVYLPDTGGFIARYWVLERVFIGNTGFSNSVAGDDVYVGHYNGVCIMRDCNLISNMALTTTQHSHGSKGIGWYGSDGIIDNCFVGCYSTAGIYVYGGASDITLEIRNGGTYWNDFGILVGGTGVHINGTSIDHNYQDGIYAAYPFSASGCTFHSNSLQTNNTWSHIRVANPVVATITGCRQAPQDGDAPGNICAYFIAAANDATVYEFGSFQEPGATLGTGWTNYQNYPFSVLAADNQTGTSYTLLRTDAGKVVGFNNASPVALTIPTNAVTPFTIGTEIRLFQQGAGQVTVGGGGVTIRSTGGKLKLTGQYSTATLRKRGPDEWVLEGDIAA